MVYVRQRTLGGEHVEVTGSQSGNKLIAAGFRRLPDQGTQPRKPDVDQFRGNYIIGDDHVIGIDAFVNDGEKVLLFSDYQSGAVRELFKVSDNEYLKFISAIKRMHAPGRVEFALMATLPVREREEYARKHVPEYLRQRALAAATELSAGGRPYDKINAIVDAIIQARITREKHLG